MPEDNNLLIYPRRGYFRVRTYRPNPDHTYNVAGYYNVSLQITNKSGTNCTTKIGYIQVNDVTTPGVKNSTIIGNVFSVNQTGNEPNYTYKDNNIILEYITGSGWVIIP